MPAFPDLGADLALLGTDGRIVALVEVKNKRHTNPRWAAELRRNIFAHGQLDPEHFFLLATPDRLYFWERSISSSAPPTIVLDARPLFEPYLQLAGVEPGKVSGHAFELVVADWLRDLALPARRRRLPPEHEDTLRETGFLEATEGSHVEFAAAA